MSSRIRYSNPQIEFFPTERPGRSKRGLSTDISSSIDDETLNSFSNNQLLNLIDTLEKENRTLYLENLFYTRYLRRVQNTNILETFDEYEDDTDVIDTDSRLITHQTTIQARLPEIARRSSVKRNSTYPTKMTPLWSKLVINWREYIYTPFLLRLEKEKYSMAAYEIEQTQLDWERMKLNAQLTLNHLDDLLRAYESDEIAQENLLIDLHKSIKRYRDKFQDKNLNNSRIIIPAEFLVHRINKRIHLRISLISLLNINTSQIQIRIRTIDDDIHILDDLQNKIDINFIRTRKTDYIDTYRKLDEIYKSEKSSQYAIFNNLYQWKKILFEEEQTIIENEYKYNLLKNYLAKVNDEIEIVRKENNVILSANIQLQDRIDSIRNVPTITSYAHIIEQTKKLQHQIYVWTKRVNIAQVCLHLFISLDQCQI